MPKTFFRLVKPSWGVPTKFNGNPNPQFISKIDGPNIFEGADFSSKYLKQKNEEGYGIYYFPNHPDTNVYEKGTKFLNGKMITVFNFVFADIDFKDGEYGGIKDVVDKLSVFPVRPSKTIFFFYVVHLYWSITDLTRAAYVALQLKLIKHFNSDRSVFTTLQLLRYPGFLNTKNFNNFVPCEVLTKLSSQQAYTIADLMEVLPELSEEEKQRGRQHIDRLEGRLSIDFNREGINVDELPDRFLTLLLQNGRLTQLFDNTSGHTPEGNHAVAEDMRLCHFLYSEGFTSKEAFRVMSNTQTALSKQSNRLIYAHNTVEKVFDRRKLHNFLTVSDFIKRSDGDVKEPLINGPRFLDGGVLGNPWRRKEILGVISGSGIGKTAFSLNIVLKTIENNLDNDDVYVFVSLEMTKGQIIERWINMVGIDSPLADRLFVIDTFDADGKDRLMGLQEIYETCSEIKQHTGKQLGMVVIDFMHIISTHIDLSKQPNFGVRAEGGTGYGTIRNVTLNQTASQLRALAGMLDTFLIVLAQTPKASGIGDVPLFKDACFGASNFDWVCHRIITLWQPLLRCQDKTSLRVLAFQYGKIRELHIADKIKIYDPKLLTYDMVSGILRGTNATEYREFLQLLPEANELRTLALKREGTTYSTLRTTP